MDRPLRPDFHSRDRRRARIVYPVLSRRSGGLSLGINLYPDGKRCNFDCPYCEVRPGETVPGFKPFTLSSLEHELREFLDGPAPRMAIRDFCISGDGEPTLSPRLGAALELLASIREHYFGAEGAGAAPRPGIVLITNSTGFSDARVRDMLSSFFVDRADSIWAKLDSADARRFGRLSGSAYSLPVISDAITSFSARTPLILQTMLCALPGESIDRVSEDPDAYAGLIARMVSEGARFRELHAYTTARPPADARIRPCTDQALEAFRRAVESRLGPSPRLRLFGSSGEIFSAAS